MSRRAHNNDRLLIGELERSSDIDMKRNRTALDQYDEATIESPAKRVTQDVSSAEPPNDSTLPWTHLFSSILGVEDPYLDHEIDKDTSNQDEFTNNAVQDPDPDVSFSGLSPEMVGRQIASWADATISEYVGRQRPIEDGWAFPIGKDCLMENDHEQCFGMIHECRIRLFGDMQSLRHKLMRTSAIDKYIRMQFTSTADTGFLKLDDGTLCAQLDQNLYAPLKRIMQVESTRLLAYASVSSWVNVIDHARSRKGAETNIDINVYGLASVRITVGQKLSEDGLYLQHVKYSEENVEYENPHMLKYDDDDLDASSAMSVDRDPTIQDTNMIQQTILDVCSGETMDRPFQEFMGCVQVKVGYYQHQKQAIAFMIEREVGPINNDCKLWRLREDDGRPGYRNLITDCWAAEPHEETGGGILADDPGMGKTLSTLSLIGQRLGDAQKWSRSHDESFEISRRESVRSRATLVVVPSLPIIAEWDEQIQKFMDGSLKVLKYHGRHRCKKPEIIADADIVFTTYHTLAVERKTRKSPMKTVNWFRIVLDEAHYIRRQATTLYAAVTELDACHRWCLTGTPIQNKLDDLGALLAFIRADSFKSISMFRKHIVSPFSYDLDQAKEKLSILLRSICMRRSIERLRLPSIVERLRHIELSNAERVQYTATLKSMLWELSHGSREKYSGTPFGKFQIQLQLRRLCNHGTFQRAWTPGQSNLRAQVEDAISSIGKDGEVICSLCHEPLPVLSAYYGTSHVQKSHAYMLCDECRHADFAAIIQEPANALRHAVHEDAPSYRNEAIGATYLPQPDVGPQGYSAKVAMLMLDVNEGLADTKSIIFSSWTSSLDLVQQHLQTLGIKYMRVDGNLEPRKRRSTFDAFKDDQQTRILLMTTGTGAYGLNLTIANRIFILEPQWNPSIEIQAIARAQRMSQEQSVLVTRYIVLDTVEEDIVKQQKGKLGLAQAGFQAKVPTAADSHD